MNSLRVQWCLFQYFCFLPARIFSRLIFSKTKNLQESLEKKHQATSISFSIQYFPFYSNMSFRIYIFCVVLSMEEDFVGQNRIKGDRPVAKRSCSSQKCIHCLKPLSKRRILQHQNRCPAAKFSLPDGFKVEVMNGKTVYFCQCGYRGQRCRVLSHIEKCAKDKEAIASTKNLSSVAELEEYRHSGHFEPLFEA